MEEVWKGVDRFLDEYVRVRSGDRVVLAYTPDSRDSAAWVLTTLASRHVQVDSIAMAPIEDAGFPHRLAEVLPSPAQLAGRLVVVTVERDTMSHTQVFRQALSAYDKDSWLVARVISASAEFFTHGMRMGAEELSRRNTAVLERVIDARKIHVTTPSGSDLAIDLDPEYRWLSNRGAYRPGGFMVMPPGEVATYPHSVNGVLVADGAFNINVFTQLDSRLKDSPVTIEIVDGKAVNYSSSDAKLRDMLRLVFNTPNATRVGELGFGTNAGVPDYVPMNCHINERRPGLHLGFGQHNQSIYVVDYMCDLHCDFICDGGVVHIDGDPDPIDLSDITPSDGEHPFLVMDEDIDGDCCGIWLDDLRAGQCVPRGFPPPERGRETLRPSEHG